MNDVCAGTSIALDLIYPDARKWKKQVGAFGLTVAAGVIYELTTGVKDEMDIAADAIGAASAAIVTYPVNWDELFFR